MDSNKSWDKAQLAEWKSFWESDLGKDYLQKLADVKEQLFMAIVNTSSSEGITNLAGRAAGVELVIEDIRAGIAAAEESAKGEEK